MTHRTIVLTLAAIGASALLIGGCRGSVSDKPPIHPNPNMDTQAKYKAQAESNFFADGATMRTPPEHTVARGDLREDSTFHRGRVAGGGFATASPVPVTPALLARGAGRYAIYCSPCHGLKGDGKGKILEFKYPIPPTSYFEPRILAAADGYLFDVITNGIRNMPSYARQIPVQDRWAIVAHVRTLQRAGAPPSATASTSASPATATTPAQ